MRATAQTSSQERRNAGTQERRNAGTAHVRPQALLAPSVLKDKAKLLQYASVFDRSLNAKLHNGYTRRAHRFSFPLKRARLLMFCVS